MLLLYCYTGASAGTTTGVLLTQYILAPTDIQKASYPMDPYRSQHWCFYSTVDDNYFVGLMTNIDIYCTVET